MTGINREYNEIGGFLEAHSSSISSSSSSKAVYLQHTWSPRSLTQPCTAHARRTLTHLHTVMAAASRTRAIQEEMVLWKEGEKKLREELRARLEDSWQPREDIYSRFGVLLADGERDRVSECVYVWVCERESSSSLSCSEEEEEVKLSFLSVQTTKFIMISYFSVS